MEQAHQSEPSPSDVDARRLIESFFDAQQRMDLDGVMQCWHHEGEMRTPYAPAPLPKARKGSDEISRTFAALFAGSRAVRLTEVQVIATERPSLWLAQWSFEIDIKSGKTFSGNDIGTFRVSGGLIKEYVEYFDAIACAVAYGFPLDEG